MPRVKIAESVERISLFLTSAQVAALDRLKARDGIEKASATRQALNVYLKRQGVLPGGNTRKQRS